jgi:hypothetical protein
MPVHAYNNARNGTEVFLHKKNWNVASVGVT